MHSAWVKDIRLRVKCIELSLSLHHLSSPQDTCSIPRVYAVMRGGAISFSFHRRCGIYVLLIHSDIFLCVQRSEYADSFFEQDRGSGAMADTRFGRKIQPGAQGRKCGDFPANRRHRPWGSPSPVLPLRRKRNSIRRLRIKWSGLMKKQKCKAYKSKVKRWLAPESQPPVYSMRNYPC